MHPCHRQYGGTEKYTVGCRFPLERTVQDMVEICRRLMNQPTYSIEEDCRCQRSSSFFRHERNKECGTKTKPSSGLSDRSTSECRTLTECLNAHDPSSCRKCFPETRHPFSGHCADCSETPACSSEGPLAGDGNGKRLQGNCGSFSGTTGN